MALSTLCILRKCVKNLITCVKVETNKDSNACAARDIGRYDSSFLACFNRFNSWITRLEYCYCDQRKVRCTWRRHSSCVQLRSLSIIILIPIKSTRNNLLNHYPEEMERLPGVFSQTWTRRAAVTE